MDKIMKKTQDTLGKIIKKPPLTEKLLSKPPFRFLHDIITEVIRTTGFMKGLLTPDEMDSKNVTSRDDKVAFLEKVIGCVSLVCGETLSVRPSKIVAGQEAEKTNDFLQKMARCIRKEFPFEEAVQKILSGEGPKAAKSTDQVAATSSKEIKSEKHRKSTASEDSAEKKRSDDPSSGKESKESRGKSSKRRSSKSSDERKESSADAQQSSGHVPTEEERRKERKERERQKRKEKEAAEKKRSSIEGEDDRGPAEGAESSTPTRTHARPASAKGQRRPITSHQGRGSGTPVNQLEDQSNLSDAEVAAAADAAAASPLGKVKKTIARPPSARPGAPRVKQRQDSVMEVEQAAETGGLDQSAPIIVDRDQDGAGSDDDDQFVVQEDLTAMEDRMQQDLLATHLGGGTNGVSQNEDDTEEGHGGLVRKILETKKELEQSAAGQHEVKHTEIQRSNVSTIQQQKERAMVIKEIDSLRASVQKLCQTTTPLAKIIDYIQEDMDAMQTELHMWKKENKHHELQLKEEDSVTAHSLEPLKVELNELDQAILTYRTQMAATKANIIRNEEKIQKMIVAVTTHS